MMMKIGVTIMEWTSVHSVVMKESGIILRNYIETTYIVEASLWLKELKRRKKQREVGKCITLLIMKKRTWIVITLTDLYQFASYQ